MYEASDVVKIITMIMLMVALIGAAVVGATNFLIPTIQIAEAESNVSAGTVVDKEIINASSGLFSSSDMDYRIVIEGEYEYKGKTKTVEKSISVDKETYQQANIGDWFDSHTLKTTAKE